MNSILVTGAAVLTLVTLLALCHVPVGTWLHRVYTDDRDWRIERAVYRLVGVDPHTEQRWASYAVSALSFAVVSVVGLFQLIVVQGWLPWSQGRSMSWHTAFNTAVSFVTNTNWQSYAGEAGAGYVVQAAGLTVQNFASTALGLAVDGPQWFHARASASDHAGDTSGGSNLGPNAADLATAVAEREAALRAANPDAPAVIPPDALTASASGLDPHISPAYALVQAPRVAQARGIPLDELRRTIAAHTEHPALGFIGTDRVNVAELNADLARADAVAAGR